MRKEVTMYFSLFILTSAASLAEATELRGEVFWQVAGKRISEPGLVVTLAEAGRSDDTNDDGIFYIGLPEDLEPGRTVTIKVDKAGMAIYRPLEGKVQIPLDPLQIIEVELLPLGEKLFLSEGRIERLIEVAATRPRTAEREKTKADLNEELRVFAATYGFSLPEVKAAVDNWANNIYDNYSSDIRKVALAAYSRSNYEEAAEKFRSFGDLHAKELAKLESEEGQLQGKIRKAKESAAWGYRQEADSRFDNYQFDLASQGYLTELKFIERGDSPEMYFSAKRKLGNSFREEGARATGERSLQLLQLATQVYSELTSQLDVHVPVGEQARLYSDLAICLTQRGTRAQGSSSSDLLADAVIAHRKALEIWSKQQASADWARAQSNLCTTLKEQGEQKEGPARRQILSEAEDSCKAALATLNIDSYPLDWAKAQSNLGNVLLAQEPQLEGDLASQKLSEAAIAYRNALLVIKKEARPQQWAIISSNLGNSLQRQGSRLRTEVGINLLEQAVEVYTEVLAVYNRKDSPQDWARVQTNLGVVLQAQGTRAIDEAGIELLSRAVVAYRKALEVRTREELPQHWALTQSNLGNALAEQGIRTPGAAGTQLLLEAVRAYENALSVRKKESFPQQWAKTQSNLGNALQELGTRSPSEARAYYFKRAEEVFRSTLLVYTFELFPQDWARTQSNLGIALQEQGGSSEDLPSAIRLFDTAIAAFYLALSVFERDSSPQDWSMVQNNLGMALVQKGVRLGESEGAKFIAAAVESYRSALIVRRKEYTPGKWLQTTANLIEALFLKGQFDEISNEAGNAIDLADAKTRIFLLLFKASAEVALTTHARGELIDEIILGLEAQPSEIDFDWPADGFLGYIRTVSDFAGSRDLLLPLFEAIAHGDRSAIIRSVERLKVSTRLVN